MQDYNTGAAWQGGREAEMGNNYTLVRKHKISLLSGSGGVEMQYRELGAKVNEREQNVLPPKIWQGSGQGWGHWVFPLPWQLTAIMSRILTQAS